MVRIEFDIKKNKSIAYDENDIIGVCEYIVQENIWNIVHTEVDKNYQGQGIARRLVECVIEQANKNSKKLVADCSYAARVIK